jgi:hypothetical protein
MGVYKLSAAGGIATPRTNYSSFLAGNPKFVDTAFDSLQTVTVGAGGSASISFTSIPSTYKHLQIRGIGRSTDGSTNDVTGRLQFNTDTGSNYSSHRIYGYGSSAGSDASTSATQISFATILADGNTASCFSAVVCDVLDYANVNKNKTTRSITGGETNSLGMMFATSGNWRSTSAVTSITLFPSSGNWKQYTEFALYGIKGE